MGLGFAASIDPANGQSNPVLGQFLSILATFLFLSIGGHLALAATIVESYRALPPGAAWIAADSINNLVMFGGVLFSAGLSIALPVAFAIVLIQIVMGDARPLRAAAQPVRGRLPGRPDGRHRPARHRRAGDGRRHHRRDPRSASRKRAGSRSGAEPCPRHPDKDQQTEAPTPKRRRDAAEKGDVLQSRELGTALVVLVGAAWIAFMPGRWSSARWRRC